MNTATIRSDWVGCVVDGKFTLLQWLGGSGEGGVFLTELAGDRSQKAAIKLIPADEQTKAHIAAWLASAALSHPNLMRLFHSGSCEIDNIPLLYAVMEYADENLAQILPERSLTPAEVREMLDPVLEGLSYLHGKGFVHGRLKPSNILVVDEQLKLSGDRVQSASATGAPISNPTVYDAPERATGAISPAADLWSLGVTLVEALTQHPPVWDRSAQREPAVPESIPQPFTGIVRECLRRDPSRRCGLTDIQSYLAGKQPQPVPEKSTGSKPPSKLITPARLAAALALLALVAFLLVRALRNEPSPSGGQASESAVAAPPSPSSTQTPPAASPPPSSTPAPLAAASPASNGVTEKGAVAQQVLPEVLPAAQQSISGKVNVRIRVTVDPGGQVSNASLDSPGPSRYFARVAFEAAQRWRFKPAQAGGQDVSSVWTLEFHFTQTATEVTPVETSP
ncbi:MAG: TonB family protein [Terracidiphilus sp.]